jgi:hypothetical protein
MYRLQLHMSLYPRRVYLYKQPGVTETGSLLACLSTHYAITSSHASNSYPIHHVSNDHPSSPDSPLPAARVAGRRGCPFPRLRLGCRRGVTRRIARYGLTACSGIRLERRGRNARHRRVGAVTTGCRVGCRRRHGHGRRLDVGGRAGRSGQGGRARRS